MTIYNDLLTEVTNRVTSACNNIDTVPAGLDGSWSKVIAITLGGAHNRILSVTVKLANPIIAVTSATIAASILTLFDGVGLTSGFRTNEVKMKGFSFLMKAMSDYFSKNIKYVSNPNASPADAGYVFNSGTILYPSGTMDYSTDNSLILDSLNTEFASYVDLFISSLASGYALNSIYITHTIT